MRTQINLASAKQDTKKTVRKAFLLSLCVFSITFLISAILLMVNLFQNNELSNASTTRTTLESNINAQKDARNNALILKDRLQNINKILSSRFDLKGKLITLMSLFPSSLTVTGVDITKEKIIITVSSDDLNLFDTFLEDKVVNLEPKDLKDVKRIDLSSFRVDRKSAKYILTIAFNLNDQVVPKL